MAFNFFNFPGWLRCGNEILGQGQFPHMSRAFSEKNCSPEVISQRFLVSILITTYLFLPKSGLFWNLDLSVGSVPVCGVWGQQRGRRLSCAVNEHSTAGVPLSSAGLTGNLSERTGLAGIHIKTPQALFNSPWKEG